MLRKVLVVDDDQEFLGSLKQGLARYEDTFFVKTCRDGLEAAEHLKRDLISLVVTDLKMPRMDGLGLLGHIMEHYPEIPVIVMTGYSTAEMERLARQGGALGYIEKPFGAEDIAVRILTALRRESDGGTLHGISSSMFLQLIEMEGKTCTIRLRDRDSGQQGILFFQNGQLLDARVRELQGLAAAYEIFSWENVSLSIQNSCVLQARKIHQDLQAVLLEAQRLKDEADQAGSQLERGAGEFPSPKGSSEAGGEGGTETDFIQGLKQELEEKLGENWSPDEIYQDDSWDGLVAQLGRVGKLFGSGAIRVVYMDQGDPTGYVVLPGDKTTVLSVHPKCPRERLIHILIGEA